MTKSVYVVVLAVVMVAVYAAFVFIITRRNKSSEFEDTSSKIKLLRDEMHSALSKSQQVNSGAENTKISERVYP